MELFLLGPLKTSTKAAFVECSLSRSFKAALVDVFTLFQRKIWVQ
jgi:hypothetical protein